MDMSRSSPTRGTATGLLVTATLLLATLAGCLDATEPRSDDRGSSPGHGVTLMLSGLDAPEAGDDHAVAFTIGHIGLFDSARNEWVPLLTEPVQVTVTFTDTSRSVVDTFAILEGDYTEVELLLDAATVIHPSGTDPATVDEAVCYAPIRLDLTSEVPPDQLELLVSGSETLRGSADAWRVRPALVGSLTDETDNDPTIADVDCTEA